ncbi:MAG: hypothetical protein HY973_00545 [Candidatus Kerfeldbacteria bacterium]|nr:hypothetical protein [Candidatus Kerfeldbacteria bacterium]
MIQRESVGDYKVLASNENGGDDYLEYLDDRKGGGKCRGCNQELGAAVICPNCGADNSSAPSFERKVGEDDVEID